MRTYLAVMLCLWLVNIAGATEVPSLIARVNDHSNVLTEAQKQQLEATLKTFEESTSNQIAILILPALDGEDKASFANKVFKTWKLGQKDKSNGVLLLNATKDRKVRIEVGYGLEGALTDALSLSIVNEMMPLLKQGDYFTAYSKAVENIILATKGEYQASGSKTSLGEDIKASWFPFFLFVVAFFLSALAGSDESYFGGIVGAVSTFLILYVVIGATIIVLVIGTAIGAVVGFLANSIMCSVSSGSGGGYSSSDWGSGGGGFSGGGGDSGGGGAGGDY